MAELRARLSNGIVAGALLVTALLLQGCTDQLGGSDHDINIHYKCTEWKDNMCRQWEATGQVYSRKKIGCFPANATVIGRTGPVPIAAVRIGDELLGFNPVSGQAEFTAVRAWLHRESKLPGLMVRVQTDTGDVLASPTHNLAVGSTFKFARDIKLGDILVTPTGPVVVNGITWEDNHMGAYAPLTWGSNLFVGPAEPSASSFFLAHSFAMVQSAQRIQGPFHALLSAVEFFVPSVHDIDDSKDTSYLHPVCRFFLYAFGIQTGGDADIPVVNVKRTLWVEAKAPEHNSPLRGRRLDHKDHEEGEDQNLPVSVKVILDHPPFLFDARPQEANATSSGGATTE